MDDITGSDVSWAIGQFAESVRTLQYFSTQLLSDLEGKAGFVGDDLPAEDATAIVAAISDGLLSIRDSTDEITRAIVQVTQVVETYLGGR